MPIYEYRCKDCETVFETFVSSISDADKVVCKKCESKTLVREPKWCIGRCPFRLFIQIRFLLSMTSWEPGRLLSYIRAAN
jgi:putative FmdB family regulatory protein